MDVIFKRYFTLTVNEGDQIPDDSKECPGTDERSKEVEYCPRPRKVDRRDEQIFQNPNKKIDVEEN